MDEEMNKTIPQTAPIEPETQEVQEHAEEEEVAAQPTSEAHAEEVSGNVEDDTAPTDYKVEFERLKGKTSKIEKENNEYLQKVKLLEALDRAAANDPEFMKLANKKLVDEGVLDPSVLTEFEQNTSQQSAYGVQPDPAVLWAKQKMQAEQQEREKFLKDFEDRHPDLTDGDSSTVSLNRSAVGAVAAKRMKEGYSQSDAYEFAYKVVANPSKLIEEGELQGLAKAQGATPVEGAASGANASSSGTAELTPEQKEIARRFGISEEKYAKSLEE